MGIIIFIFLLGALILSVPFVYICLENHVYVHGNVPYPVWIKLEGPS